MNIHRSYIIVGLFIAFVLFVEIAAHADEWNKATILTFSEPVEIPGQILPAGTYLFKMADTDTHQDLVQIFNSDGTLLLATLQTALAERAVPTDETVVVLAEAPGKPDALVKWFYSGDLTGNEFLYSREKEKELAHDKVQMVTVRSQTAANANMNAIGK
jgi:hypothetical protein